MKHVTDVGRYFPLKSYWIGDCCVYVYSRRRKTAWAVQRGTRIISRGVSRNVFCLSDVLKGMTAKSLTEVTE